MSEFNLPPGCHQDEYDPIYGSPRDEDDTHYFDDEFSHIEEDEDA